MTFVPVTADVCNVQGITSQRQPSVNFRIRKDLIVAIFGQDVRTHNNILNIGTDHYNNLRLADNTTVDEL